MRFLRPSLLEESSFINQALLFPPSLCYGVGVKLRNFLYDHGTISATRCGAVVVSVGNLVVGGTGKTPFILMLAKRLIKHLRVAILLRGYKSEAEHAPSRFVEPHDTAKSVGDESLLLYSNLPEALVVVGKDRVKSAELACERGAEVILLDDGMQHRRLHRDIEIVLLNGKEKGHYLPAGFLRDDPKRLAKADLVVTSQSEAAGNVVEVKNVCLEILFTDGRKKESLKGCKVAVFCGIGFPERFLSQVKQEAEIVATKILHDHEKMQNLKKFAEFALEKGADFLLCTEKDRIKLSREELVDLPLPLAWTRCESVVTKNEEAFAKLIDRIMNRCL